jgi:RNA polymerase sigma factor (sigma-70 family)
MTGGEQETALLAERSRLVRLCFTITGDASAAEDLAQEALLVGWQQEQALRDPQRRAQRLSGIARNLCLHWQRRKGLERTRSAGPCPTAGDLPTEGADTIDLEADLERQELVELLDRAMALLPPETRAVLVARYVQEAATRRSRRAARPERGGDQEAGGARQGGTRAHPGHGAARRRHLFWAARTRYRELA